MLDKQALWQGEDQMLKNLKNSVKRPERMGVPEPGEKLPVKTRALLTQIEDVLFYYPNFEKHVPRHLRPHLASTMPSRVMRQFIARYLEKHEGGA